jgi:hypothetical protein
MSTIGLPFLEPKYVPGLQDLECNCKDLECNCKDLECNCKDLECNCKDLECNCKDATVTAFLSSYIKGWEGTRLRREVKKLTVTSHQRLKILEDSVKNSGRERH